MPSWNLNRDKEFVDNLKLDYAAMDTATLAYARSVIWEELYVFGSEMRSATRATKQVRLAVLEEVLTERGHSF